MLVDRLLESQNAVSDNEAKDMRAPLGEDDTLESTDVGLGLRFNGETCADNFLGDVAADLVPALLGELTSRPDNMSILFSRLAFASSSPSASFT